MPDVTRKRRLIVEEEEEDGSRRQANRAAKGKRSRRMEPESDAEANNEMNEDDENDEDDDDDSDVRREEPEGEGWSQSNNASIDDMTWQEIAEREYENSRKKRGRPGLVAEIGVIEMIEMQDFMCHRHLRVPFGPKINFIIGHNGSGKSAILTAIMVCLGGKANATNRAQSLKALIREGAAQADVKLQLRNQGHDAYKPELYGESIIIERRISKDGASGYKIKSSKGKSISTKREELAAICDHMNIQVDNPVNVLSQDTARQFIQSSTPEDKYKFFMKGTQLTQLSQDYEIVRNCIETMQTTLKSKREVVPELYQLAKAAQARFRDMQVAAGMELKVEDLKSQVAWAQIEELEKVFREAEEDLNRYLMKVPAMEAKKETEEKALAEIEQGLQEIEVRLKDHAESNGPTLARKRELEVALREKKSELKMAIEEEKTVNEDIKNSKEQVRKLEQWIAAETQKLNSQSKRVEIEDRIRRLEEENDRTKRMLGEARENLASAERKQGEVDHKHDQITSVLKQSRNELAEAKDRIQRIRERKENALKAFGPSIPDVLRDIEEVTARNGWRAAAPVGPIGRHVKLRHQNWAAVIESALGNNLNAFAVQDDHDGRVLRNILQRRRCNSPIFTTKQVLFRFREPDEKYLTINRALHIDDEWVQRLLIDKAGIEQTILVEQRQVADRITSSGPNGGMPENVTRCLTLDLIQVGDRSGGAASIMMQRYRGPPRLSSNVDQELGVLEGTVSRCQDSIQFRIREMQELVAESESLTRDIQQFKRDQGGLDRDLRKNMQMIETLNERLREDMPTNLEAYEESRQKALSEIETMKKQYEPIALQKQKIIDEMEPFKQELATLDAKLKSRVSESSTIVREQENLHQDKVQVEIRVKHWEDRLKAARTKVRELELDLGEKTQTLQEQTQKATEFCERVEVKSTIPQLEREIKQIQERLREQAKDRGYTFEEVALDMKRKQDEYKAVKAYINQLDILVKQLKDSLDARLMRWRNFRSLMAMRSTQNFRLQLAERGYSGDLDFSHTTKQLHIRVETEDTMMNVTEETKDKKDKKDKNSREKDPKSLSGGERSFSTICMLLALWDSMASSIRCLDEFDVFMDAVNRRISMKMLISTARESDGVQYILITPQDASSVSPGPDVRVHRLHDPERNQLTLV
ncbi:Structural maintenance of chromosomes protein 6 [Podila epigama]|nr:Structural maintenance of chromosomes protein 6 [Podila epigama]